MLLKIIRPSRALRQYLRDEVPIKNYYEEWNFDCYITDCDYRRTNNNQDIEIDVGGVELRFGYEHFKEIEVKEDNNE